MADEGDYIADELEEAFAESTSSVPVDKESESDYDRAAISLYEFYALGIERLIVKAPWELERAVSAYHESFLTEQRCLGLSILLLLGENQVPTDAVQSMPGYETQARFSVNQAVFRRALKRYFESRSLNPVRADMVIERMGSYITDSREAEQDQGDPLEAMFNTLARRVPPLNDEQSEGYAKRVEKIFDYVSGLVEVLLKRYEITS
ncbi:MAG TPA: hypothetical protein VMB52_05200 [Verrucomicrobiae bacterium]|nr:hypothetical protein [Verrucomicrobiae bacterium]